MLSNWLTINELIRHHLVEDERWFDWRWKTGPEYYIYSAQCQPEAESEALLFVHANRKFSVIMWCIVVTVHVECQCTVCSVCTVVCSTLMKCSWRMTQQAQMWPTQILPCVWQQTVATSRYLSILMVYCSMFPVNSIAMRRSVFASLPFVAVKTPTCICKNQTVLRG